MASQKLHFAPFFSGARVLCTRTYFSSLLGSPLSGRAPARASMAFRRDSAHSFFLKLAVSSPRLLH
jgi:hypothetical protein